MFYQTVRGSDGRPHRIPSPNQRPRCVVVPLDAAPLPAPTPRPYDADRSGFGPTLAQETAPVRQAKATDRGCSKKTESPVMTKGWNSKTHNTPIKKAYPYGRETPIGSIVPPKLTGKNICLTSRPSTMPESGQAIKPSSRESLRRSAPDNSWLVVKK